MTIPTDEDLDAVVARLEPRLFMTLGARSRRRRLARILGGTAAGAGLVAAGLAIGVYLVPTSPASLFSAPSPAPSASGSTGHPDASAGPSTSSRATTGVVCHDADGAVVARLRLAIGTEDPAGLCTSIANSGGSVIFGADFRASDAVCRGASGSVDVYAADGTKRDAATLCAGHGTTPITAGTK